MPRNDIHAPGSPLFDPQAYDLVDVFDLHPDSGEHSDLNKIVDSLADQGINQAPHSHGCGHCGQTNLRYVALLIHRAAGEWIFVGQDCLAARFTDQTRSSFLALKKAAELARAKQAKKAAWLALLESSQDLVWLSYIDNLELGTEREFKAFDGQKPLRDAKHLGVHAEDHKLAAGLGFHFGTLVDIARKARTYGELSDKQAAFVGRLLGEIDGKVADYVTKMAARAAAPAVPALVAGRQVIEGEVLVVKWQEGYMPGSSVEKMLVKLDGGQRVWGSVPSSIMVEKGDRVRFDAKVEPKDSEADFGFYSRPTKASVVTAAAVAA